MRTPSVVTLSALLLLAALFGCASYATPGRGAHLGDLAAASTSEQSSRDAQTDATVLRGFDPKPLAQLPASIAVVRIQAPDYWSRTAQTYGAGKFCVVTTRDIEDPQTLETWQKMPQVLGLTQLPLFLLPHEFNSDRDLRLAAARLHADMLLVYTIDTTFTTRDQAAPLTLVSLGLFPSHETQVITTASAILIDTRSGYIYGTAEATDHDDSFTTGWTTDAACDNARQKTERESFKKMASQVEAMWAKVLTQYPSTQPAF